MRIWISWSDLMGFWIFKRCRHGLFWMSMKLSHGYFEYSWSDVIGILNVQKLTSNEYSKADVRCKYSCNDLMGILNNQKLTSWTLNIWGDVIGILNTKWRYGIIQKLTPWVFWIFIETLVLRRFLNIHSNDVTSRIFKIPMSLWIFKISMTPALNFPMTALREFC